METKIGKPPINHEMIQLALRKFFDRGGKIIETENPYGDTPVKQSFSEKERKIIDPDPKAELKKNLFEEENLFDQEMSYEELHIAYPYTEHDSSDIFLDADKSL